MESSDFNSENAPRKSSNADSPRNNSRTFEQDSDLEDDADEVQMSSQEVLESLQRSWMNEKFAPDLLPYEDALVEMVMIQLVHMEENLASANKNDLLYIVHRMEVERIRFIVASYLRCRLQKIESYASHFLDTDSTKPRNSRRLSEAEHKFAVDFHESVETHFYQLVVRHMPQNHQDDERVRRVGPNVDAHVFARARQNVGEYSLGGGENSLNIKSASMDPYSIVSEQDYEKLDEFIPHISEVPIGTLLSHRILDPAIGKYFTLAQFSIQYLLFCKQFLDETVVEIRNSLQGLHEENVRLEKMNRKRNEETALLQRKLQRTELVNQQHTPQTAVYPCTMCTKNFVSSELLNAHMIRKHTNTRLPENSYERKSSNTDASLINTIKLELEVKQLKERLNVAEKDLLNRPDHRCRVCSEHSNSTHDEPKAKILHNIGIQSNLSDDKDINEREAQTQTETLTFVNTSGDAISKPDVQYFIDEQKRLFECWKDGERQKFNEEIKAVKQNIVDAIRAMEKTVPNSPIKVYDDDILKERYQELEKMFKDSQKQTRETMTTFEKTYTQKMDHLEALLTKMILPQGQEYLPGDTTEKIAEISSEKFTHLKVTTLPEIVIESENGKDVAISGDISDKNNTHRRMSSSESECTRSDEELRKLEAMNVTRKKSPVVVEAPHVIPKESSQLLPSVLLLSPKRHILSQFCTRLKMIGIDAKSEQLSGGGLNDACEALAIRRDVLKKKHKHFFITRKHLLSKVDQLARIKVGELHNSFQKNAETVEEKPKVNINEKFSLSTRTSSNVTSKKSSPAMDLLFPNQTLLSSGMPLNHTTDTTDNSVQTKSGSSPISQPIVKLTGDDVITVHTEVTSVDTKSNYSSGHSPFTNKRPSISNYHKQVERLLDTPIKTLNPIDITSAGNENIEGGFDERNSDVSEMLDTVPAHPKPIPKKRVLFNLDKAIHSSGTSASLNREYKTLIQRSKLEEESDWNISSFDEDK